MIAHPPLPHRRVAGILRAADGPRQRKRAIRSARTAGRGNGATALGEAAAVRVVAVGAEVGHRLVPGAGVERDRLGLGGPGLQHAPQPPGGGRGALQLGEQRAGEPAAAVGLAHVHALELRVARAQRRLVVAAVAGAPAAARHGSPSDQPIRSGPAAGRTRWCSPGSRRPRRRSAAGRTAAARRSSAGPAGGRTASGAGRGWSAHRHAHPSTRPHARAFAFCRQPVSARSV